MASANPNHSAGQPAAASGTVATPTTAHPSSSKEGPLGLFAQAVNVKLGFGRLDSDGYITAAKLNIDILNRVATATYNQLVELSTTNPPMTSRVHSSVENPSSIPRSEHSRVCDRHPSGSPSHPARALHPHAATTCRSSLQPR